MPSDKPVAVKVPRKLIEVALPLDAINAAAGREKSIRHGHPSTLHLWWARRPLAAARAVLFAQLVNDPGYERNLNRGVNKVEAAKERERLFKILEDLVVWENSNDERVLSAARAEICKSWRETCELNRNHPDAATLFDPEKMPAFHDPFAGGGAIPLEAQRLGLESYASDLNPVAVMINKAMIEIPPRFAGLPPVGPVPSGERDQSLGRRDWPGAAGIAEDVRRYGIWIRSEAERRIEHLYPKVEITEGMAKNRPDLKQLIGRKLTVIAWLWARTVKSPNPAYSHVDVPLVSNFVLSSKPGKEAYVETVVNGDQYAFEIRIGKPTATAESGTKAPGRGANFRCLLSNVPITGDYIKAEGQADRMGSRLLAIVAEGTRGRIYLRPTVEHEQAARLAMPHWKPSGHVPARLTGGTCVPYGMKEWGDLFTSRQLVALNTFSELVGEARSRCKEDALASALPRDARTLEEGGVGAEAYSQAIGVYLSFGVSRAADAWSSIVTWRHQADATRNTFARQALPMTWDFAEANPFSDSCGNWIGNSVEWVVKSISSLPVDSKPGVAEQADAGVQTLSEGKVVSTDPPYYDNIGYADLSDFFYVWLRRLQRDSFRNLFSTVAVPKSEELVAAAYRHGGVDLAERFFLNGMTQAIRNMNEGSHPAFPITIYYAFKQSDSDDSEGTSSSGWVTFLEAVMRAGLAINGTWPMRTEKAGRVIGNGNNALASSIILVCRKRDASAPTISRREFLRELHAVLPDALVDMTKGGTEQSPVAPVDLSQAIIGPGMASFSKYKAVLEADGTPMSVKTALQLINRFLADDEFDPETQFCLQWFEANNWKAGTYGQADVAARAKGTSADAIARSGVLRSGGGQVQLKRSGELEDRWSPERGNQTPVWEGLHHLIRALNGEGEQAAGRLLARMPALSGPVRTLSYRLYTLCERKGLAEDARSYNALIGAWSAIEVAAQETGLIETQAELFPS
jgi:putative DNA methylase